MRFSGAAAGVWQAPLLSVALPVLPALVHGVPRVARGARSAPGPCAVPVVYQLLGVDVVVVSVAEETSSSPTVLLEEGWIWMCVSAPGHCAVLFFSAHCRGGGG